MSDTRSVAIRCAQWLEVEPFEMDLLAAEELRRLHTENERLRDAARMALEALVYHREQTRPIHSTDEAIDAPRDAPGEEK